MCVRESVVRRKPAQWRNSFAQWIRTYTVRRLVRDLEAEGIRLSVVAVYQWIAGRTFPRPRTAAAIVRISGGRVTFEQIYPQRRVLSRGT
jgi:hypothetical protein